MSIEDYRTNFKILGKENQSLLPPFISSPQCVKAITISKNDTNWLINNNPNSTKNIFKKKSLKTDTKEKDELFDIY